MRAAYYDKQGAAVDVLTLGDMPLPLPEPGDVRVRIAVSGVNPSDIKARTGFLEPMPYDRVIPHQDGAGWIDVVGEGVDPARIGERVWLYEAQAGNPHGTAAEFVVVPASQAVPLPDAASFAIGASLGIPALTAHRCLFADGELKAGRVLVHGGAGVVGEAAILLAKWAGAWVAATVRSSEDEETARRAGADLVINMREQDVAKAVLSATEGTGVDRIVEVDLASNLQTDLAVIAPGGVVSTYALKSADDAVPLPVFKAMVGGCVFRFVFIYTVPAAAKLAAVNDITACLTQRAYRPTIGLTVPLDSVIEAHEALEARAIKGKILVEVAPVADTAA